MREGFGLKKIDKITATRTLTIIQVVYAQIVPSWTDQLLPRLLNLHIHCRHIEHMHEGVWFKKMIFDNMTATRI